jgi:curli biogenesis system outer membrane secretion channel CsgG
MKKFFWSILILGGCMGMAAPAAEAQAQPATPPAAATSAPASTPATPQGHKKRVAIFDFDYATVQTASAAVFGTNVDVGKGIADLLVNISLRTARIPSSNAKRWTRF